MSNEVEIKAVRQVQLWDVDRGPFKVKRATFHVGKTVHTLDVSMADFDAGRMNELVLAEAEKIKAPLGRKK